MKQIPVFEDMSLGPDGRLVRDGLELHMNDYCRRAVAKGHEIARSSGGSLTVITMGPPSAENVLREALAFGADRGVLVSDPAFAGSDTWATARTLAAAIAHVGPFDLLLLGRNSVDADTGQVPPQLAELAELPFLTGVREITVDGEVVRARLEHDDEWVEAEVELPAMLSCAERLCDPCKIKDPDVWAAQDGSLITRVGTAELGEGPWGQSASPTEVGQVRSLVVTRDQRVLDGPLPAQVADAMAVIVDRSAHVDSPETAQGSVVAARPGADGPRVCVMVEPDRPRVTRELLGAAAGLAADLSGRVDAIGPPSHGAPELSSWGADRVVVLDGVHVEEDIAAAATEWCGGAWAVLAPGTAWGREIASRLAARLDAGLTGDAVGLTVRDGRLVADKPAFGGALVAEILCSSPVQMATVRPGVLPTHEPRPAIDLPVETVRGRPISRVRVLSRTREDDSEELATAQVVIGVGQGVDPAHYGELEALAERLDAALCATRKVTDKGWMPRARQVGITGHSIAPRLYIGVGTSGKYNHTVGVRSSGTVVGINPDPDAALWRFVDVGLVADWREALPLLVEQIELARSDVPLTPG